MRQICVHGNLPGAQSQDENLIGKKRFSLPWLSLASPPHFFSRPPSHFSNSVLRSLFLLRIQTYARKNTLIFCLFLLGTVLSSLSLLFFYGNSMADKRNMAQNSLSYRTFTLYADMSSPSFRTGWRKISPPFGGFTPVWGRNFLLGLFFV